MIKSKTTFVLSMTLVAALAACGPLLPKGPEAPRLFSLSSDQISPDANRKYNPVSLQIQAPQATPGLDTDRISLKKGAHETDYFAGAKWTGSLPSLVQARVIDGFERSKTLRAVAGDTVPFTADYILSTDITDFQAEYQGATSVSAAAPVIRVRFVTRLTRGPLFEIVATETIEETEQARANNLESIVGAANKAFDRALGRVIETTVKHLPQGKKSELKAIR